MQKPEPVWQKQDSSTVHIPTATDVEKERRHRKGVIWILTPLISLPIVLSLYAVVRYIAALSMQEHSMQGAGLQAASTSVIVFQILTLVLSALPIIFIPLGIIMGLYYFLKK